MLALCAPTQSQMSGPSSGSMPPQHRLQGSAMRATQAPQPGTAQVTPPPAASAENIASAPPSLLDKPAEPATIDLGSGRLTIRADNSSLADILNRVKADSGMAVDGLSNDQRVFGSYGPGDPQEVLYALLNGTGYNVVMLGRTETGTPRELSLTPRSAGGTPGFNSSHHQQEQVVQDEDNDDEQLAQPIEPPGAPQPDPPQPPNGVRTPQQMLQELQQMRQQQQLQMQQQQQAEPPQQQ